MGTIVQPKPVLLLLAAFSRYPDALRWAKDQAIASWGDVALESEPFVFDQTDYYTPTMGPGLIKQFFAMDARIDPSTLASVKRQTNHWEEAYAAGSDIPEPRPLNLDPGYITPAKLVLASTKDYAHRIYLRDGIYAEVTLSYSHGAWRPLAWTFPDYHRVEYHAFFTCCREFLHQKSKNPSEGASS